ncbi:MAG: phenylacetate--CoA ligase [Clostridiaceae bacterium]|jgi:phenylacetate-CoA ligase|nr:phenylacetate--CoA ligase [Oscillospiraceae bacterium]NLO63052.1 phenylacetate--CoA ligase [Clostridiaceae bacterium]
MARKEIQTYIWDAKAECMSQDELRKVQSTRLVACVKRMYERVPYYRKKMDEAGIVPEDIKGIDDLPKLPFTDKYDFRDNYPFGTLAVPREDIVRFHASSGTTGRMKVVGYTRADIALWTDCLCRSMARSGVGKGDLVHIAYGYGLFTGGLGPHYACDTLGATAIPVSGGNTPRQIQILREWQPNVILCTPSYMLHLADKMAEMGVGPEELNLKCGIFGAEPWTVEMRNQIEEKVGLRAFDIYGLSEILGPGVGCACAHSDLIHLEADHFIPEVVDPETGKPLPEGELGELVFSSVTKEGTPLLRYNTHDLTRLYYGKCECGRTTPRMEKVTGRADDMLIIRGVNVFPTQIEAVMLTYSQVEPHYIIVIDRVDNLDRMTVKVEMSNAFFSDSVKDIENIERKLAGDIASITGVHARIVLCEPRSLPRSEGKIKRVYDERFK